MDRMFNLGEKNGIARTVSSKYDKLYDSNAAYADGQILRPSNFIV